MRRRAERPECRRIYERLKAETTSYLGDPEGFTVTGELVAAGPVAGLTAELAAGLAAGTGVGALPWAAGRNPRLPGLLNMFVAR